MGFDRQAHGNQSWEWLRRRGSGQCIIYSKKRMVALNTVFSDLLCVGRGVSAWLHANQIWQLSCEGSNGQVSPHRQKDAPQDRRQGQALSLRRVSQAEPQAGEDARALALPQVHRVTGF